MGKKLLVNGRNSIDGLIASYEFDVRRCEEHCAAIHGDNAATKSLEYNRTCLATAKMCRDSMVEIDNDEGGYVFDKLDKYWREHGGTSREMDYAEAFANYLLDHIGEK